MGPEQAAGVLAIVTQEKLKRDGKPVDAAKLGAMKAAVADRIEKESTALFATARLWDDGLIDPRDSRRVLGLCLSICREAQVRQLNPSTFGVARM
jgi:geranyl-CoA carboxylase beta subunit